jgi:hypothetical protein
VAWLGSLIWNNRWHDFTGISVRFLDVTVNALAGYNRRIKCDCKSGFKLTEVRLAWCKATFVMTEINVLIPYSEKLVRKEIRR